MMIFMPIEKMVLNIASRIIQNGILLAEEE